MGFLVSFCINGGAGTGGSNMILFKIPANRTNIFFKYLQVGCCWRSLLALWECDKRSASKPGRLYCYTKWIRSLWSARIFFNCCCSPCRRWERRQSRPKGRTDEVGQTSGAQCWALRMPGPSRRRSGPCRLRTLMIADDGRAGRARRSPRCSASRVRPALPCTWASNRLCGSGAFWW